MFAPSFSLLRLPDLMKEELTHCRLVTPYGDMYLINIGA